MQGLLGSWPLWVRCNLLWPWLDSAQEKDLEAFVFPLVKRTSFAIRWFLYLSDSRALFMRPGAALVEIAWPEGGWTFFYTMPGWFLMHKIVLCTRAVHPDPKALPQNNLLDEKAFWATWFTGTLFFFQCLFRHIFLTSRRSR